MKQRLLVFGLALACGAVPVTDASGQRWPAVSLDATAGLGASSGGGNFRSRGAVALDALFGIRLRPAAGSGLLAGLSAGLQGPIHGGDDCLIAPGGGGCVPHFPLFYSAGALVGWERAGARGPSVRVLAGPAYYRADEGGRALALQGRLDLATPALFHIALVASLRGAVLPDFRGDALACHMQEMPRVRRTSGVAPCLDCGTADRQVSARMPKRVLSPSPSSGSRRSSPTGGRAAG